MIYGPYGAPLVEPLSPGEEGILCADIDLSTIDLAKQLIEVVDDYSRPDLLSLHVNSNMSQRSNILEGACNWWLGYKTTPQENS